jgi:O-antigen/teichoic acid export membrane protein
VTALDLARQGTAVVAVVALALAGASLLPFLAVPIVAGGLGLALTAAVVRGLVSLRPVFALAEWRALLRDVVPWAVAAALATAYFRVALIVTSLVADELETGIYATSFRIVEVLVMVPGLAVAAAVPILGRAAAGDPRRFDRVARRTLELALVGGSGMAVLTLLGAPVAVEVVAGAEGRPAVEVLRLHAGALLPTFVAAAAGMQLLTLGRAWTVAAANAGGLIGAVVLAVVLVPGMGASGAALATVCAEVGVATVLVGALARGHRAVLAALPYAAPACALAGAAAALALVPWMPALAQLGAGAIVYTGGLVLLRRFPPEVGLALGRGGSTLTRGDPRRR